MVNENSHPYYIFSLSFLPFTMYVYAGLAFSNIIKANTLPKKEHLIYIRKRCIVVPVSYINEFQIIIIILNTFLRVTFFQLETSAL